MIADAGFEVEGTDSTALPQHRAKVEATPDCGSHGRDCTRAAMAPTCCGSSSHLSPGEARNDLAVRGRGADTDLAPNG